MIAYISAITAISGLASGSTTDQRNRRSLAPSSCAASYSSSGIDGAEEGQRDDDLPDPDRLRDHHRPPGVQQAERLHHQVRRDQAAGEQHREEDSAVITFRPNRFCRDSG